MTDWGTGQGVEQGFGVVGHAPPAGTPLPSSGNPTCVGHDTAGSLGTRWLQDGPQQAAMEPRPWTPVPHPARSPWVLVPHPALSLTHLGHVYQPDTSRRRQQCRQDHHPMGAARREGAMGGHPQKVPDQDPGGCWWPRDTRLGRCMTPMGGISGGTVGARAERLRCPPGSPPPRAAPAEFGVILQRKIMVIFLPPYA